VADPQKPDPSAPWCPKCEGHTETEWVQAGDSGRNVHQCVSCGWTAFEVGKLKAKTSAAATNIFFLTLILFPILVVVGMGQGTRLGREVVQKQELLFQLYCCLAWESCRRLGLVSG